MRAMAHTATTAATTFELSDMQWIVALDEVRGSSLGSVESDPSLIGASAHIMAIGQKK